MLDPRASRARRAPMPPLCLRLTIGGASPDNRSAGFQPALFTQPPSIRAGWKPALRKKNGR